MNSRAPTEEKPAGEGGAVRRKSGLPASEKGTGIIPEDESGQDTDTRTPASEEDSGLIEREDEETVQSWPGSGGPGTIPPPGLSTKCRAQRRRREASPEQREEP